MKPFIYSKQNLIEAMRTQNTFNDTLAIKNSTNITIKTGKNLSGVNKYALAILSAEKTIWCKYGNNYIELIDELHDFLMAHKLIKGMEKLEEFSINGIFDGNLAKIPNSHPIPKSPIKTQENPREQYKKGTLSDSPQSQKQQNPHKLLSFNEKEKLRVFFRKLYQDISLQSDVSCLSDENGKVGIYIGSEQVKEFDDDLHSWKQFIITYLVSIKDKKQAGVETPDAICILFNETMLLKISIHDFFFEDSEIFIDPEFGEESNPFTLCNSGDLFIHEAALNGWIDELFVNYKVETITGIEI